MSFNPDRTKQAQVTIFPREKNAAKHLPRVFSSSEIKLSSNQKYLGLTVDSKLSFNIPLVIKFIRQTKVLVSFKNCKIFYHVTAY